MGRLWYIDGLDAYSRTVLFSPPRITLMTSSRSKNGPSSQGGIGSELTCPVPRLSDRTTTMHVAYIE